MKIKNYYEYKCLIFNVGIAVMDMYKCQCGWESESRQGCLMVYFCLYIWRRWILLFNLGEEIRSRDMLSSCLTSAIEQAKKLGMGNQKWWTFLYKGHQVVMLNLEPFYAFMFAATSAETGVLCNLADKLQPILNECEQLFKDILMISTWNVFTFQYWNYWKSFYRRCTI